MRRKSLIVLLASVPPSVRIDLDGGTYFDRDGGDSYRSGANFRRARVIGEGTIFKDIGYRTTYDSGGTPGNQGNPQELQINYQGF